MQESIGINFYYERRNADMELDKNIYSNYYKGANKARNSIYGELSVSQIDLKNGTFTGESRQTGFIHSKLKMKDFYFYEFH